MERDRNRDRRIFELRKEGKTYKEIGELLGISAGRAGQLYQREKWYREQEGGAKEPVKQGTPRP